MVIDAAVVMADGANVVDGAKGVVVGVAVVVVDTVVWW